MARLRLYLETSVFSFAVADDVPEGRRVTRELLEEIRRGKHEAYLSNIVLFELNRAREPKRSQLHSVLESVPLGTLVFDDRARQLADRYLQEGIIPRKYQEDAFHIAIASVHGLDAVISWNFKHIVKLKTKREVTGINLLSGYREIELYSPWEVADTEEKPR